VLALYEDPSLLLHLSSDVPTHLLRILDGFFFPPTVFSPGLQGGHAAEALRFLLQTIRLLFHVVDDAQEEGGPRCCERKREGEIRREEEMNV